MTAQRPNTTATILRSVQQAGEDFEWYPTTQRMIDAVKKRLPTRLDSIMDVGAGDGRVLVELAKRAEHEPKLYAIEKSQALVQQWPDTIIPAGTDVFEQNLACIPVDYIFCNPPYSHYEAWSSAIIESGFAKSAYLVIPQRWNQSAPIAASLKRRGATAKVIHSDDFHDAERRARAVIDVVEIRYPRADTYAGSVNGEPADPFDIWFDQNIDTFDREVNSHAEQEKAAAADLARINGCESIPDMVAAYDEEYARMEANYRGIFKLDYALLNELGVKKDAVRDGIKKKMADLKLKYWRVLFERLDAVTKRLATATKEKLLAKLNGRSAIAFTANNAYAVVLWAIKNANHYYGEQLVKLFRDLSTFDGVLNYKSNQRTWQKDGWRYQAEGHSHYSLDYRIVVTSHSAIKDPNSYSSWDCPGNLDKSKHELLDDCIAVFHNLGFALDSVCTSSRRRSWVSNGSQEFWDGNSKPLIEAKAFKNGNMHLRFNPDAIRALNVEAGRLLGWLRSPGDVERELGYPTEESQRLFGSNRLILPSNVKLLTAAPEMKPDPRGPGAAELFEGIDFPSDSM